MLEWLKQHWFLLVAILTAGIAWGQTQSKITTLEDVVKENAVTQQRVQTIEKQSERIDERTKAMMEGQARQERLIEMMLQEQRKATKGR
jgi:hypothetical protein